jgi:hypothetical protein
LSRPVPSRRARAPRICSRSTTRCDRCRPVRRPRRQCAPAPVPAPPATRRTSPLSGPPPARTTWALGGSRPGTAGRRDRGGHRSYESHAWRDVLAAAGITHKRTRPYRPQTNGKVERFDRTLPDEWAHARPYRTETERRDAYPQWPHTYNHHRGHTALKGQPPASRVPTSQGDTTRAVHGDSGLLPLCPARPTACELPHPPWSSAVCEVPGQRPVTPLG